MVMLLVVLLVVFFVLLLVLVYVLTIITSHSTHSTSTTHWHLLWHLLWHLWWHLWAAWVLLWTHRLLLATTWVRWWSTHWWRHASSTRHAHSWPRSRHSHSWHSHCLATCSWFFTACESKIETFSLTFAANRKQQLAVCRSIFPFLTKCDFSLASRALSEQVKCFENSAVD